MDIDFPILEILDILTGSAAIMLGLLFLTIKSDNRKANIFLGLFLWSVALQTINSFIIDVYIDEPDKDTFFLFDSLLFILLFLFFYISATINRPFKWWYSLLFIPGILHNILIKIYGYKSTEDHLDIYIGLFYLFEVFLLIYVFRILKTHKKRVNNFYSELESKTLWWIKSILIAILFLHFIFVLQGFLEEGIYIEELLLVISSVLLFFIVYWIGYNGFSQHELFKHKLFLAENKKDQPPFKEKELAIYGDQESFDKVIAQIQRRKLYTDSKLNLRSLSQEVKLKEKELSRLINQRGQVNFYHFINEFRVEEFKNLLHSPKSKQLSIIGLAQEAGFSSKSTFYTAFKTIEGITPKEYQLRNNL